MSVRVPARSRVRAGAKSMARVRNGVGVRSRTGVGIRSMVRVRVRVGVSRVGNHMTSHSVFYSRVAQIVIFSHIQSYSGIFSHIQSWSNIRLEYASAQP